MPNAYSKLDQALIDLIDAYVELEAKLVEKHDNDEDEVASGITEALEASIDSAIEDQDFSTSLFASVVSKLSDALEQLDPSAFENEEDFELGGENYEVETDDIDLDDLDEDEDIDD